MAKDLPYFKFFCSEWNDGDITLESFEIQGLFINICSYYWSNECDISIDKLHKRFKHSEKNVNYLFEIGVLHNEDSYLSIHFLDEQSVDRNQISKKNSKAGLASAEARRLKKLEEESNTNLTPVEITLNENPTIKRREDKKRKEEEKKQRIKSSLLELHEDKKDVYKKWALYRKSINKSITVEQTVKTLVKRFNEEDINKVIYVVNTSIENGWQGLFWDKYDEKEHKPKRDVKVVTANEFYNR